MSGGKTTAESRQELYKQLTASDAAALEAGNLAFLTAKELEAAAGCRVYGLNPHRPAVISRSMKKTDKEDVLKLARILEDMKEKRLPTVPVPGAGETGKRKPVCMYRRIQGAGTGVGAVRI